MEQTKKRLDELHNFIHDGINTHYRQWMENKFKEHPELMEFEIENVPEYLVIGVAMSKLENIKGNEIRSSHFSLDRFKFTLPLQITSYGAGGYWGDPYEAKGKLEFNIGYQKGNELSINASYDAGGLAVYQGASFTLDNAENVIVSYVRRICNGLEKGIKI